MVVRVVKSEPSPDVEKEIVCLNCGQTLAYVPNDIKYNYGETTTVSWVDCPCGKKAIIR